MKSSAKVIIAFRVRADQVKLLRAVAKAQGVSLSEMYRRALDLAILKAAP